MENSKLPADVQQEISEAAKKAYQFGGLIRTTSSRAGYIAGAAEWAEKWWASQLEIQKLETVRNALSFEHAENVRLAQENERLKAALEEIKVLYNNIAIGPSQLGYRTMEVVIKALAENGKEGNTDEAVNRLRRETGCASELAQRAIASTIVFEEQIEYIRKYGPKF
jgi:hypothetical protein